MLDQITKADFAQHVQSTFVLHRESGEPIEVQLVELTDLKGSLNNTQRDPFSICFLGPSDILLPQRIYRLSHATLGELDIFLVPIGPDAAGRGLQYEAVFN